MHEEEEEERFNMIFLDVNYKDLYNAWDEYTINEINDYKNDRVN